jgi:purine-nucleoside phosphorylase
MYVRMAGFDPQIAATRLKKFLQSPPALAVVLGTGFHHVLNGLHVEKRISWSKIPGFPKPTVPGHAGEICYAELNDTPVLILNGRAHFYEGHSMEQVTFPIRVLAELGIRDLLLTNAAGGIHPRFRPGDFMVLTDHINFMGVNPLRGTADFTDLTRVYDETLTTLLSRAARVGKMKLHRGVYLAVSGPSYETPAEIRAFGRLGADAVGMSTVPEAIVARQCGLNVAAISCITNRAAGLNPGQLSHVEVLETLEKVKHLAAQLLSNFVRYYGRSLKNPGHASRPVVQNEPPAVKHQRGKIRL